MSTTLSATRGIRAQLKIGAGAPERGAVWLLAFVPTTYLALSGGGYDITARSELGVLAWWLVVLGVVVAVLPRRRLGAPAWIALALMAGFMAWSWLALGWTQSHEQTLQEVGRLGAYLAVLVLGFSVMSRANVGPLLCGLASAIAFVSLLAVLSRLVPSWFSADPTAQFYATARLSYPFDYSDGVGEFAALGLPLLLYVATSGKSLTVRVLGASALPIVVLCLALTVSRGGILAAAVGLAAFFALAPDRLPRLATALIAAVGSAVVMFELLHLSGVRDALKVAAPASQRHAMLLVLVIVCVVVGVAQAAMILLSRARGSKRRLTVSRRASQVIGASIALVLIAVVAVGLASGTGHRLWEQFKEASPPVAGNPYFRLLSVAGSHRYQYWVAAIHAFDTDPWKGIGPGTFQFYWSQHNSLAEFVRNAHSLWIETLAETGIIGLALVGGLFVFTLIGGSIRALRRSVPLASRLAVATAVSATAAFCAAAAFDWVWQIGVVPMIAMLLIAAALGGDGEAERRPARRSGLVTRVVLGVATVAGLWAILIPLAQTIEVRASQTADARGDYVTALKDVGTAQNIEPSAATPRLQRALILEQLGDISGASAAIAQAQAREPTNWRLWFVGSRIAIEAGQPRLALTDYKRARALDPTSGLFRG